MLESLFQSLRKQLQETSPEEMDELRNMVQAFNQMLRDRFSGLDPDFEGFMERYGRFFDPDRPTSLDELVERLEHRMAAMRSLMASMSPEMRRDLESANGICD